MRKEKKRFGNKPWLRGRGEEHGERRSSTLSIYSHILSNVLEEGILMDKVHRTPSSEANCPISLVYLIYLIISSALFSHAKKLPQWPFIICFSFRRFSPISLLCLYFLLWPFAWTLAPGHWLPVFSVVSGTHIPPALTQRSCFRIPNY